MRDLQALQRITATPGRGVTRFSYTEEDGRARDYLARIAGEYGFQMDTDSVGNIRICPPASKGTTIIGSHIDTVRNGGWLDGIYGVISGVEVLRTFADHGAHTDAAVMVYAEEEGSVFGSTMTGSKFLTGKYTAKDLSALKDEQGVTLQEHLKACGYWNEEVFASTFPMDFAGVHRAVELHIEQGPVMDTENLQIGIVDTVFGMHVLQIEFVGLGNHAGASPMIGRRDCMCAFAEAALAIEQMAIDMGCVSGGDDREDQRQSRRLQCDSGFRQVHRGYSKQRRPEHRGGGPADPRGVRRGRTGTARGMQHT